jgi:Circadian oscillating protein COP23
MKIYLYKVRNIFLLPISLFVLNWTIDPSNATSWQSDRSNIKLVSQNKLALADKIQLTCGSSYNDQLKKNVPTTIAKKGSEKRAIAQWVRPMGNYWTPQRRCEQVSQGMQTANAAGNLKYITNGKMNGQRVICTETEVLGDCNNLLMALRTEDKSLKFLGEIKQIFNAYQDYVISCGSGEPHLDLYIDLDRLWKNAPKV